MFIFALSDNFSVAVFFQKTAIPQTICINTLKAFTIFIFFNCRTITKSFLVHSFKARTICEMDYHFPIKQTFFEIGLKYIAIFLDQLTLAMLTVIAPITSIGVSIGPIE